MARHKVGSKNQPFPVRRPEITITRSEEKPFDVDCREVPWWFAVPEVGNRTLWAMYDPPEETKRGHWRITWVYDMEAVRPATIHDVEGVEISVQQWNADSGWLPADGREFARITYETVEWIAVAHVLDGRRTFLTYLDDDFEERCGPPMIRRMVDRGRFEQQEDDSYVQREHDRREIGAGIFTVAIGERSFECLRVIDICDLDEEGQLMEAFLTREGRTVLCRRHNGRRWKVGKIDAYDRNWDERFPDNQRLVIDGVTYVHWYDCLTSSGMGMET